MNALLITVGMVIIILIILGIILYPRHNEPKVMEESILEKRIEITNSKAPIICTVATTNILDYFTYTYALWVRYCYSRKYPFHVQTESLDKNVPIHFTRLHLILKLMIQNPNSPYIIYVDADTYPIDDSFEFDKYNLQLIAEDKHIAMVEDKVKAYSWSFTSATKYPLFDGKKYPNSGVILLRNTKEAKEFVEHWIFCYQNYGKKYVIGPLYDQLVLWECVMSSSVSKYLKVLDIKEFNSVDSKTVVHLMGRKNRGDKIRKYLIKKGIPKIIHQQAPKDKSKCHKLQLKWKDIYPEYDYMMWTDEDNEEFIKTYYSWFYDKYKSYSENIHRIYAARLFILYTFGGIYADTDYKCFKRFESHLKVDKINIVESPIGNEEVQNSLMACIPGHVLWWDIFNHMISVNLNCDTLKIAGPKMFTDIARKNKSSSNVLPWKKFNETK